jgi:hypothetical protein
LFISLGAWDFWTGEVVIELDGDWELLVLDELWDVLVDGDLVLWVIWLCEELERLVTEDEEVVVEEVLDWVEGIEEFSELEEGFNVGDEVIVIDCDVVDVVEFITALFAEGVTMDEVEFWVGITGLTNLSEFEFGLELLTTDEDSDWVDVEDSVLELFSNFADDWVWKLVFELVARIELASEVLINVNDFSNIFLIASSLILAWDWVFFNLFSNLLKFLLSQGFCFAAVTFCLFITIRTS